MSYERNDAFVGCDQRIERRNIIFCFPSSFGDNGSLVADRLQIGFDFIANHFPMCGQHYSELFSEPSRILIGFRRGLREAIDGAPVDEGGDVCAGYFPPERRVNVPWNYLKDEERSHGFVVPLTAQPEYCCVHELSHAFEAIRLDGNPNQDEWKEGLCDFIRALVLRCWASEYSTFAPISGQYEDYIRSVDPRGIEDGCVQRRYHYAARLLLIYYDNHESNDLQQILEDLFQTNMTTVLGSWRTECR